MKHTISCTGSIIFNLLPFLHLGDCRTSAPLVFGINIPKTVLINHCIFWKLNPGDNLLDFVVKISSLHKEIMYDKKGTLVKIVTVMI